MNLTQGVCFFLSPSSRISKNAALFATSVLLLSGALVQTAEATPNVINYNSVKVPKGLVLQQPTASNFNFIPDSRCTMINVNLKNPTSKSVVVQASAIRIFAGVKTSSYTGSKYLEILPKDYVSISLGCLNGEYTAVTNSGLVLTGTFRQKQLTTFNLKKLVTPKGAKLTPLNLFNLNYDPITRKTEVMLIIQDSIPGTAFRLKNIKVNNKKTTHMLHILEVPMSLDVSAKFPDVKPIYAVSLANIPGDVRVGKKFKITGSIVRERATPLVNTYLVNGRSYDSNNSEFQIPDPATWKYDAKRKVTTVYTYLTNTDASTRYDLSALQLSTRDSRNRPINRTVSPGIITVTGPNRIVNLFTLPGDFRTNQRTVTVSGAVTIGTPPG